MKNENNKRNRKICWTITAIAAIFAVLLLICFVKGCNDREEQQILKGWKFDWSIGLDQRSNSEENGEDKKKEEAENKQDKQDNQDKQETDSGKQGSEGGAATNNQTNEASGNLQQPADQLQGEPEVPKDGDEEIKSPITSWDIVTKLPKNLVYNGKQKSVKAHFVDGVTGTLEIKYYTKSYGKGLMKTPPVNAGKYYVLVKGKGTGKFCGRAVVGLIMEIDPKPIAKTDVKVTLPEELVYDTTSKEADVTLKEGVTGTITSIEYTGENLVNKKPVNAGKYTVTVKVKGSGNYTGEVLVKKDYVISPKELTKDDVKVTLPEELVYDTTSKEADVTLKEGVTGTITSIEYTGENLVNKKPVNAGKYTVTVKVKGSGNYTGEVLVNKDYVISPKELTEADVKVTLPEKLVYDMTSKEADVTLKEGVTGTITSIEYTGENLVNKKPVNAGKYTVTVKVKGSGNYTGEVLVNKDYVISPKELTEADVKVTLPEKLVYDMTSKEADVTLKEGVTGTITSIEYTGENLVNKKPINAGFYNVTVEAKGTGNYAGEVSVTKGFSIKKAKHDESNILFANKTFVYNEARTYSLKVEGSPVPAWYEGNDQTEVGEYEVTVYFVVDSNHEPIAPRKAILTIKASSEGDPGEGETDPPTGEDTTKPGNPGEGEQVPPVEEDKKDPEEGEQPPASGEEEKKPEEGEQPPASGEEEKAPEEGKQPPAVEEEEIQEDEQTPSQPSGDVIIEEGIQKNPIEEAPIIESIKAVIAAVVVNNRIYKI